MQELMWDLTQELHRADPQGDRAAGAVGEI
jgi:hypothetical protein